MKKLLKICVFIIEILMFPFIFLMALFFRIARFNFFSYFSVTKWICRKCGMVPVIDHYYYPIINEEKYLYNDKPRKLKEIDFNIDAQLKFLKKFHYQKELTEIQEEDKSKDKKKFYYNNNFYTPSDAQYLYNLIRAVKPKKYIEIGSGYSTLMALEAREWNGREGCDMEIICIEPYEQNWLEKTDATILRRKVEDLEEDFFEQLEENDILFIDSSHVIRPEGDVLYEFENILPKLRGGYLFIFMIFLLRIIIAENGCLMTFAFGMNNTY